MRRVHDQFAPLRGRRNEVLLAVPLAVAYNWCHARTLVTRAPPRPASLPSAWILGRRIPSGASVRLASRISRSRFPALNQAAVFQPMQPHLWVAIPARIPSEAKMVGTALRLEVRNSILDSTFGLLVIRVGRHEKTFLRRGPEWGVGQAVCPGKQGKSKSEHRERKFSCQSLIILFLEPATGIPA